MATSYNYTKVVDFGLLMSEIDASAIVEPVAGTTPYDNDAFDIWFATDLSSGDQTILDNVIASHTIPTPPESSREISQSTQFGTTNTAPTQIPNMVFTAETRRYFISFTTTATSTASGATIELCFFVDDQCRMDSIRAINTTNWALGSKALIQTQAIVECTGGEVVGARIATTQGSVTIYEQSLCIIELEN